MILLDTLLVSPLLFVLRRIQEAVDAEMNDAGRLREELLAAQMRLELGELGPDEFAEIERQLLARLRALREDETRPAEGRRVVGIDARTWDEPPQA